VRWLSWKGSALCLTELGQVKQEMHGTES
jgi:hypothetical protein